MGEILPNSFIWRPALPNMKIRQRHCKERKLQASISLKHRYKNLKQNLSISNPTM